MIFTIYIFFTIYFFIHYQEAELPVYTEEVQLTVRFTTYPSIDGNKLSVVVRNQNHHLLLNYWMANEKEKESLEKQFRPGSVCTVSGELIIPDEARNPNLFNYRQYLKTLHINYSLKVSKWMECSDSTPNLFESLLIVRQQGISLIQENYSETVAPFIIAMLFGERNEMDIDVEEAYQKLGLSHLLAISGLHVTIFTGIVYYLFIRIGITKEHTRIVLLITLPIYAILAGGSPSVIRAVFMSWVILFLWIWRNKLHPLDGLGITFIFYILFNPYMMFHVGFQLSYFVTACLILSKSIIEKCRTAFSVSFMITLIAQMSSLPILLYHFFEISLLSLFLNLIYIPLYSVMIMPLSIGAFVLSLLYPQFSFLLDTFLSLIFQISNELAILVSKWKLFTLTLGKPPLYLLLLYFFTYSLAFLFMEKQGATKIRYVIFLFVYPLLLQFIYVNWSPIGEVTMIDVGQGDSILIRLPYGQGNYLIDTGGVIQFNSEEWMQRKSSFDTGKDIVVPFLKSKGITRIDKLVLTHGDMDHIGSVDSILKQINVLQILVGSTINKKEIEENLIQKAKELNIDVQYVFEGMRWESGGSQFQILYPRQGMESDNNSSIVIYANIGGMTWLFTGDLEEEGEKELLKKYPSLQTDVLKIGHHGSKTSTTEPFLLSIKPKVALISAGRKNRFGHPHQVVVERLVKEGVMIYRTDENGAITYSFFNKNGKFNVKLKHEKVTK